MKLPRWLAALMCAMALTFAGSSRADADPKVNDAAHFFKPDTIAKVDAELKQIKTDTNVEIVVESFESIPADRRADWDTAKNDDASKHKFYESWIESRGRELKLSGVYVLIVRQPSHLEVLAGKRTHEATFPHADQQQMTTIFLDGFKAKQFDSGLEKAVDFARDAIKRNLHGQKHNVAAGYDPIGHYSSSNTGGGAAIPAPAPTPAPVQRTGLFHGTCMTIGLIVIGVIVLLTILGKMRGSSGGSSNGPTYGPGQGGYGPGPSGGRGGGFMSGIFGGLLGGAAGSYLENRLENHHNSNNANPSNPVEPGPNPSQNDYGSTGGDFGSSSSSNDYGSTGGDFGGGGDSGGSSGGDSGGGGSTGGDF